MEMTPNLSFRNFLLVAVLHLYFSSISYAAIIEEVIDVPVSVKTLYGQEVNQTIKVTVFRDDQREKAPYLVLNHGRPANADGFAKMKRQRYSENSQYFVSLGFVVFVPTRVGYGDSGGPDVEYSGRCEGKDFAPGYAAAVDQTVAVLKMAENFSYVDVSRGIVVGQSFGGMTAIAIAARGISGLVGAVNFAGGGGGNPQDRPENPCGGNRLGSLYKNYGATSKVPTLWLYSENDRYWGPDLPKKWFNGFVEAGGKARFVELPPYMDNGHGIFSGAPSSWKSAFEDYVHDIGF